MEAQLPSVRCFVGVQPTAATVDALADLRDQLQGEGREVVKWHPPEKWHVTLCFLGEREVRLLPVFEAAVAEACRTAAPFELSACGLNLWPSARRARVVSLKISGNVLALAELQGDVARRLRAYLPDPEQEFTPHLTLGYVRRGGIMGISVRQRLQQLAAGPFPPWTVNSVTLMQGGAKYRTLAEFALRG